MPKNGSLVNAPKDWLTKVPHDCDLNTVRAKRLQVLTLQRSLLARAMQPGATTAEVNACAKSFALLESVLLNGKSETNGEPPATKPKRTAGLKSKLLSSAVQPTASSGSNEVQNQPDIQASQPTDDTTEASEP